MNRKGLLFAALLVLMVLANAGLAPLLSPLLYTLTPLQRHYLPAYTASSFKGSNPQARTEIRWMLKLRPKPAPPEPKPAKKGKGRAAPPAGTEHELDFAWERDVAAKPVGATVWAGDAVPFRLSAEAEREGWTGLDWSVPEQVESGKLRDMLCADYFGGERWWSFFAQPVFAAAALALLVLFIRAWLQGRRERPLWGPPRSRYELLWQWALQPPRPTWETYEQPRRIEPARAEPRQLDAPRPPAPAPEVPQRETVAVEPSARPARATADAPKAAYIWDESQGIE